MSAPVAYEWRLLFFGGGSARISGDQLSHEPHPGPECGRSLSDLEPSEDFPEYFRGSPYKERAVIELLDASSGSWDRPLLTAREGTTPTRDLSGVRICLCASRPRLAVLLGPVSLAPMPEESPAGSPRLHLAYPLDHREAPTSEAPIVTAPEQAPARHRLEARFLGRFAVSCDDQTLALKPNSNAESVLKYLLAHKGRPVSQDALKGWLWPDSSPKKARWSLNSAVYSLRRSLSSGLPHPAPSNPVPLEAGHYRLSPEFEVSLDTEEFDSYYERGRSLEKKLQGPEASAAYEKAVGMYEGDYLSDSIYEGMVDWTTIERERLAEAYMDMLNRLAGYYMEIGHLRESIVSCYRLLEKDCCHEDSYRILMRCNARLGLRVRALQQYWLCRQTLEHHYGIDASADTEALYKSVLRGERI